MFGLLSHQSCLKRVLRGAVLLLLGVGCAKSGGHHNSTADGHGDGHIDSRGTITFATNQTDIWNPTHVVDLDLASGRITTRFQGMDAQRTATGDTAYLAYLGGNYNGVDLSFGVTVADAQGIPGPSLYIAEGYGFNGDQNCQTPKLSPHGDRVAFGIVGGGGQFCIDRWGLHWTTFVVVRDRATGEELARFEGYYHPEWLPNGDLLMMGSDCEEGGIEAGMWITDTKYSAPVRIDGGAITTPGTFPTVNPADSNIVAFVWNSQLWQMTLDAEHTLTQLTSFERPVLAATWSPDGTTLAVLQWDVVLPTKTILFFKPGDPNSVEVRQLPSYPRPPVSWN